MKRLFALSLTLAALMAAPVWAADGAQYEGVKVCTKCHDVQGESWAQTVHAKAMDSLKPNAKAEAKKKAGLDAAKDYTQDPACLQCHTTGFGHPGGYAVGMPEAQAKVLASVGCEDCHGPGSLFRQEHGNAENRLKRQSESTERAVLVKAGQNFDYEQACNSCHLNYHGSPWAQAKEPFTPFTPAVDPKYGFDFAKAVRMTGKGKAIHEHYKLTGVFKGDPEPPLRAEFQKTAKEPE